VSTQGHTPGPWELRGGLILAAGRWRSVLIAQVFASVGGATEYDERRSMPQDANGRLVVAAPEMYEALECAEADLSRALDDYNWQDVRETLVQISNVCAKARGEEVKP
jgi:hypothetical protein